MHDSYTSLRVYVERALDLARQPDLAPSLGSVAPLLEQAAAEFRAQEAAVRDAMLAWAKERPEAEAAIEALSRAYDRTREVVKIHLPGLVDDGPASTHGTPTETMEAAGALVDVLLDRVETAAWAAPLRAELEAALNAAVKEVDDKNRAGEVLQQARGARAVAADHARERFRQFRRLIALVHGRSSRQYQSLRSPRNAKTDASTPGDSAPSAAPPTETPPA